MLRADRVPLSARLHRRLELVRAATAASRRAAAPAAHSDKVGSVGDEARVLVAILRETTRAEAIGRRAREIVPRAQSPFVAGELLDPG